MRDRKEYTIWNNVTPVAIASSTDASPAVVTTSTNHLLKTGQQVMIFGHTTNIAVNGVYQVVVISPTTFSLLDYNTLNAINGSGAGSGSGGNVVVAPKIPKVSEYRNVILQIGTVGTATLTVKIAGSLGIIGAVSPASSCPNFGAAVSPTNPYTFLQAINLDTAATINGATGIAASGADINLTLEINTNAMEYMTLIPTSWTSGAITAKLLVTDNE